MEDFEDDDLPLPLGDDSSPFAGIDDGDTATDYSSLEALLTKQLQLKSALVKQESRSKSLQQQLSSALSKAAAYEEELSFMKDEFEKRGQQLIEFSSVVSTFESEFVNLAEESKRQLADKQVELDQEREQVSVLRRQLQGAEISRGQSDDAAQRAFEDLEKIELSKAALMRTLGAQMDVLKSDNDRLNNANARLRKDLEELVAARDDEQLLFEAKQRRLEADLFAARSAFSDAETERAALLRRVEELEHDQRIAYAAHEETVALHVSGILARDEEIAMLRRSVEEHAAVATEIRGTLQDRTEELRIAALEREAVERALECLREEKTAENLELLDRILSESRDKADTVARLAQLLEREEKLSALLAKAEGEGNDAIARASAAEARLGALELASTREMERVADASRLADATISKLRESLVRNEAEHLETTRQLERIIADRDELGEALEAAEGRAADSARESKTLATELARLRFDLSAALGEVEGLRTKALEDDVEAAALRDANAALERTLRVQTERLKVVSEERDRVAQRMEEERERTRARRAAERTEFELKLNEELGIVKSSFEKEREKLARDLERRLADVATSDSAFGSAVAQLREDMAVVEAKGAAEKAHLEAMLDDERARAARIEFEAKLREERLVGALSEAQEELAKNRREFSDVLKLKIDAEWLARESLKRADDAAAASIRERADREEIESRLKDQLAAVIEDLGIVRADAETKGSALMAAHDEVNALQAALASVQASLCDSARALSEAKASIVAREAEAERQCREKDHLFEIVQELRSAGERERSTISELSARESSATVRFESAIAELHAEANRLKSVLEEERAVASAGLEVAAAERERLLVLLRDEEARLAGAASRADVLAGSLSEALSCRASLESSLRRAEAALGETTGRAQELTRLFDGATKTMKYCLEFVNKSTQQLAPVHPDESPLARAVFLFAIGVVSALEDDVRSVPVDLKEAFAADARDRAAAAECAKRAAAAEDALVDLSRSHRKRVREYLKRSEARYRHDLALTAAWGWAREAKRGFRKRMSRFVSVRDYERGSLRLIFDAWRLRVEMIRVLFVKYAAVRQTRCTSLKVATFRCWRAISEELQKCCIATETLSLRAARSSVAAWRAETKRSCHVRKETAARRRCAFLKWRTAWSRSAASRLHLEVLAIDRARRRERHVAALTLRLWQRLHSKRALGQLTAASVTVNRHFRSILSAIYFWRAFSSGRRESASARMKFDRLLLRRMAAAVRHWFVRASARKIQRLITRAVVRRCPSFERGTSFERRLLRRLWSIWGNRVDHRRSLVSLRAHVSLSAIKSSFLLWKYCVRMDIVAHRKIRRVVSHRAMRRLRQSFMEWALALRRFTISRGDPHLFLRKHFELWRTFESQRRHLLSLFMFVSRRTRVRTRKGVMRGWQRVILLERKRRTLRRSRNVGELAEAVATWRHVTERACSEKLQFSRFVLKLSLRRLGRALYAWRRGAEVKASPIELRLFAAEMAAMTTLASHKKVVRSPCSPGEKRTSPGVWTSSTSPRRLSNGSNEGDAIEGFESRLRKIEALLFVAQLSGQEVDDDLGSVGLASLVSDQEALV